MRRTHKSKKGFTLLEVMLSIAIIAIIGGLYVTMLLSVHESHNTIYNVDNSTDYAMLYAKAIENDVLGSVQDENPDNATWMVDPAQSCLITKNGTPIFTLKQNQVGGPGAKKNKWNVQMTFDVDAQKLDAQTYNYTVKYDITVVDNFYDPGRITAQYSSSFVVPHFGNGTIEATGSGQNQLKFTKK